MKKGKWILISLWILCLAVAVYSGYQVFSETQEYKNGEAAYKNMEQFVSRETYAAATEEVRETVVDSGETVPEEEEIGFKVDFDALKAEYPDVVGWIHIEGTNISYPIVQAEDNDYYLKRLPDGTSNSSGSIFLDYRNHSDFADRHVVIYGHNMRNDSMFAQLLKYQDQSFYEEHPEALILTPDGSFRLQFFAGYVTSEREDAWRFEFEDEADFLSWCNTAMEKSDFRSIVIPEENQRIATLSTCSYEFSGARFVVVGILEAS